MAEASEDRDQGRELAKAFANGAKAAAPSGPAPKRYGPNGSPVGTAPKRAASDSAAAGPAPTLAAMMPASTPSLIQRSKSSP